MKKIILTLIASAALVMGSFAEGYICANDVDLGTYTSEKKEEDGFVLLPASGKPIIVETLDVAANGSEKFTKRLNMKGATCQISFPAKAGETITVEALSSSKTEKRAAVIKDADGKVVGEVTLNTYPDVKGQAPTASKGTVKAPAAGTYTIQSKSGGIYIYKINVGK